MYPLVVAAIVSAGMGAMSAAATAQGASGSQATEWHLTVDPEATEIRFTLGSTLHKVHGTVELERGEIRIDPNTAELSGELVASALSATTNHERRDREMHRKVLESDRFPDFVLHPRRLEGELAPSGTSQVEIHADLDIHGRTHPVLFPAEVHIEGEELTATGRMTVPYVEWGMRNPSKLLLRVKKFVEVEVVLAGTLSNADSM